MENNKKVNILIVDDLPENLTAMEAILSDLKQNIVKASSGREALRCLLKQEFAVILLDVQMPEMDGYETAEMIRQREKTRYAPIVFVTASDKTQDRVVRGYFVGAVDYLFKPVSPEILKAKVSVFIELHKKTQALARSEAMLRRLNETLEKEVADRTADLRLEVAVRRQAEEKANQEAEINKALLRVAELLSTTFEREDIFKRVIKILPSILGGDKFFIFSYSEELKAFIPVSHHKVSADLMPLLIRVKLTPDIPFVEEILKGKIVIIEDACESPLFPRDMADTFSLRSLMIVPVLSSGKAVGMIAVDRGAGEKPFTDRDKEILKGIVSQVATALGNSSLYTETLEKAVELSRGIELISVMHEIDRTILSALDSQEIPENTVMLINRVISCDSATILLVDEERQGFVYTAGFGLTSIPKGAFVPFGDTTATKVEKTKRVEYIANLKEIKEPLPFEQTLIKDGFLSHISIPLLAKGEVVGVLTVGAKRTSAFTLENLSTIGKLASQISVALENTRLFTDLKELFLGTIKSLSSAIDAKSSWTKGHSERVTEYAVGIGRELGLRDKELEDLKIAGLLHDIGKIGTYDILLDKAARLTDEEYEMVKKHPGQGAKVLEPIKQLKHVIPWIKHHHERYNGTGYPDGLKGEEIPLMARILAVGDTFDAMVSDRPYRKTLGMEKTIKEIKKCSGTQFDPGVVGAFLRVFGQKPRH
ncbi:MAG: response regulator [Syntrophales bacterium]|nr:response regulator [Syntrophales bacterium]